MKNMNQHIPRLVFLFWLFAFASPAATEEFRTIDWEDLTVKIEFDDPFTKLSPKQLSDLSQVANLREKEKLPNASLSPEQQTRKESLEQQLTAQGIDIDGLLARRWEIAELRQKQFETVNPALDNTKVDIGGYLLPLSIVDEKVTEFLLVPWVGACIHTPPPPKNQLIYVQSNKGIGLTSRFQPVRVEGIITTGSRSSTLFLVDGSDEVISGYTMVNATIKPL